MYFIFNVFHKPIQTTSNKSATKKEVFHIHCIPKNTTIMVVVHMNQYGQHPIQVLTLSLQNTSNISSQDHPIQKKKCIVN